MNNFMNAFNIFDLEEYVDIFVEDTKVAESLAEDCKDLVYVADKVYSGKLGDMTARELVKYIDYEIYHIGIYRDPIIMQFYIRR